MILENAQPSKQYKVMPIMISLLTAGFIGMFSETALNIALTDLMKELHITPATVLSVSFGGKNRAGFRNRAAAAADV